MGPAAAHGVQPPQELAGGAAISAEDLGQRCRAERWTSSNRATRKRTERNETGTVEGGRVRVKRCLTRTNTIVCRLSNTLMDRQRRDPRLHRRRPAHTGSPTHPPAEFFVDVESPIRFGGGDVVELMAAVSVGCRLRQTRGRSARTETVTWTDRRTNGRTVRSLTSNVQCDTAEVRDKLRVHCI